MNKHLTSLSYVDAMMEIFKDVQSVLTPVEPLIKYAKIVKRLSITIDDIAEDETSNYNTLSPDIYSYYFHYVRSVR